jgi:hypothetical protein
MCNEHLNVETTLEQQTRMEPVSTVPGLRQTNPLQRIGNGFSVTADLENTCFYALYDQCM